VELHRQALVAGFPHRLVPGFDGFEVGDGRYGTVNRQRNGQIHGGDCLSVNRLKPNADLPHCAVVRPTSIAQAGVVATFTAFTQSGLFAGQSDGFFDFIFALAKEADEARREFEAEMLSSEDTAQRRFFGGSRKAHKRAFDSWENL